MANHKSAEKRARQTVKRTLRNKIATTKTKTLIKKLSTALEAKNKEEASSLLSETQSQISRLAKLGVLKKNTSARKVSRLASKVASL